MPHSDEVASAQQAWAAFAALAEQGRAAAEAQDWGQALALGQQLTAAQALLPRVETLTLTDAERDALQLTLQAIQANIGIAGRLMGRERDILSEEMHHLRTRGRVLDAYSKGA